MLSKREKQVYDLISDGMSVAEVAIKLGIAVGSVRTYMSKAKGKMRDGFHTKPRTFVVKKNKNPLDSMIKCAVDAVIAKAKEKLIELNEPSLERCKSFKEFSEMMSKISVKSDSLEDRVEEFKDVYCKVCIYPNKCQECPTKVLMDKYLF